MFKGHLVQPLPNEQNQVLALLKVHMIGEGTALRSAQFSL